MNIKSIATRSHAGRGARERVVLVLFFLQARRPLQQLAVRARDVGPAEQHREAERAEQPGPAGGGVQAGDGDPSVACPWVRSPRCVHLHCIQERFRTIAKDQIRGPLIPVAFTEYGVGV